MPIPLEKGSRKFRVEAFWCLYWKGSLDKKGALMKEPSDFPVQAVDVALLAVSATPFLVYWDGKPVHDAFTFSAIAIMSVASLAAVLSKSIYGRRHLIARLTLVSSGLWGVFGFMKPEAALILPLHLGIPAQYLWMLGLFFFVSARARRIEEELKKLMESRR
jgi:hypothetical protein